ncbi:MAG: T9SS C-terminal target domain-containing protein, partial [Calditrichaeota bacterium]
MLKKSIITFIICLLPVLALGQTTDNGKPVKVVTDADIVGTTYWSSDTVYNMDGLVFVEAGEKLIIEAGTIVKGNTGQGVNSTALVVAQGGQIYAVGTPTEPIVFTTILDDVDNPTDIILDTTNGYGN